MLRRFFKLIAGSLLTLIGIAIVIEAIRFNQPAAMHSTSSGSWDPISEFLLCVGVVAGGYGAYLAYSGWNPEAAKKFAEENSCVSPSPGTPGEGLSPSPLAAAAEIAGWKGRGEGKEPAFSRSATSGKSASSLPFSSSDTSWKSASTPHPNPLPQGEREQEPPSDIGVQP